MAPPLVVALALIAAAFFIYLGWKMCVSAAKGDEIVVLAPERERRAALVRIQVEQIDRQKVGR